MLRLAADEKRELKESLAIESALKTERDAAPEFDLPMQCASKNQAV